MLNLVNIIQTLKETYTETKTCIHIALWLNWILRDYFVKVKSSYSIACVSYSIACVLFYSWIYLPVTAISDVHPGGGICT